MFGRSRRSSQEPVAYSPATGGVAGPGSAGVAGSSPAVVPAVVNPGAGASLGTVGLLTVALGAWVGICPFVGPLFLNAFGVPSWTWNLTNALVWLAPGALCVVLGMAMMARASATRIGAGGKGHLGTGLLVGCSGAWLLIAPIAWPVAEARFAIVPSTAWREFLYWVAYAFGPGALLVLLGGIAMGVAMLARRATGLAASGAPFARPMAA
jgi:hypothetical protein